LTTTNLVSILFVPENRHTHRINVC